MTVGDAVFRSRRRTSGKCRVAHGPFSWLVLPIASSTDVRFVGNNAFSAGTRRYSSLRCGGQVPEQLSHGVGVVREQIIDIGSAPGA